MFCLKSLSKLQNRKNKKDSLKRNASKSLFIALIVYLAAFFSFEMAGTTIVASSPMITVTSADIAGL